MNKVKSLQFWIALILILLLGMTSAWLVLAEGESEDRKNATYTLHSEAVGASEMKLWIEVDSQKSVGMTTYQMKLLLSGKDGKKFSASHVDFDFAKADSDVTLMHWTDYNKANQMLTLYAAADANLVKYQETDDILKLDLGTVQVSGMKNTEYQVTIANQGFQIVDLAADEIPVAANEILIADTDYSGSTGGDGGSGGENPDTSTPETSMPDTSIPTTSTPEVSTPETNTPGSGNTSSVPTDSNGVGSKPSGNQDSSQTTSGQNHGGATVGGSGNQGGGASAGTVTGGKKPSQQGTITANAEGATSSKNTLESNSSESNSEQSSAESSSSEAISSENTSSQIQSQITNTEKDTGLPTVLIVICVVVVLGLGAGAVVLVLKNRK